MKKLFSLFVPLLALFLTLSPQTAKADYVDDNLRKPLTFKVVSGSSGIRFAKVGSGSVTAPNLQYRKSNDGGTTWTAWSNLTTSGVSSASGWIAQIRGTNPNGFNNNSSTYYQFYFNAEMEISGNIMSIIVGYDTDNEAQAIAKLENADEIPKEYCFYGLFSKKTSYVQKLNCSNLIFPATKLMNYCYAHLFYENSGSNVGVYQGPTFLATDFVDKAGVPVDHVLDNAFYNCAHLQDVHINFTDCSNIANNLYRWLYNITGSPHTLYAPQSLLNNCLTYSNQSFASDQTWGLWTKTAWQKTFTTYTITFKDENGTTVETKEVREGQVPTYTGTTNLNIPGKVLKWSPALVAVTEDAEYQAYYVDEPDYFTITNTSSKTATIYLDRRSTGTYTNNNLNVAYSINGGEWTEEITYGTSDHNQLSISLPAGQSVRFRGYNLKDGAWQCGKSKSIYFGFNFPTSGTTFTVSGELMSLVAYKEDELHTSEYPMGNYCFTKLFNSCNKITDASGLKLSATTLSDYCYKEMFNGCSALTTAPQMSATTLAQYCYQSMFNGCVALAAAPSLPATTLTPYCYSNMFSGCSALTAAPQLNATTLTEGCYQNMFQNCTSLTDVQETLPGTNLPQNCYAYMFSGCSALTTAPEIMASANTIPGMGACDNMFASCTSLTKAPSQLLPETVNSNLAYGHMFFNCPLLTEGPDIHATTISDGGTKLQYMFSTASNLRKIRVYFPAWGSMTFCSYWTNSVAATGNFYCPPALARRYNNNEQTPSYIPTGWTVYSYNVTFVPVECTWEDATNANKQFTWKTDTSDVNSFLRAEAGAKFYTNEACTNEITISEIQALLPTQQELSAETTKYIYARKVSSYALSWDANGGVLSGDYTAAGSVNAGATITAPTATRTGYTFTGWSPYFSGTMPSTNVTYIAQWTKATTLDLYDDRGAAYYNNIKALDGQTYDVTYHRSVKYESDGGSARWYTLCLPFDVDQSQLDINGLTGKVYEYRYAEGSADENDHVTFHFRAVKSPGYMHAGQGYLVKATSDMGPDFTFTDVTLNTSADVVNGNVDNLKNSNAYKESGDIAIVGVLRNGTLSAAGKQVMGLANNKIWYPHSSGNPMPAYRAYFYNLNASASVMPRVRIVVEGEGETELEVVDGELYDARGNNAGGDVRAPSGAARKYIRNGVLIIERNGEHYNAQGARM